MDSKFDPPATVSHKRKERNFAELQLNEHVNIFNSPKNLNTDSNDAKPVLVVQSPKTPTLSRKLKAVSLDSDAGQKQSLEVSRDVSSVPNTPKKHAKTKEVAEPNYVDVTEFGQKATLAPHLGSNLQRYGSNQSISGSQTLKTLPEIMTLQEFTGVKVEPIRIKAKGLLERRGSNASLTIDLGSNSNLSEQKPRPISRLNTAKSASNLNLTSFGYEKCVCIHKCKPDEGNHTQTNKTNDGVTHKKLNHSETCGNCTIYESIPSVANSNKKSGHIKHQENSCKCTLKFLPRYYIERHCVCNMKCRRKSLSNENLYVPPCNFCHFGSKDCHLANRSCNRGSRKALYPRQTYIETSQLLSEDFKLHLQNVQYLQTAGCVLSVAELKTCCQLEKVGRLHQEFWEVPLNLQEKCLVSGSQSRNRYKGVLPNEHSRVHLPGPQPYIHANYIKGADYTETAYIATQGPMLHTCEDFWHMVWSNKVYKIVMLTALIERGRSKCELYYPLGSDHFDLTLPRKTTTCTSSICETPQLYEDDTTYLEDLERKSVVQWGAYNIKYLSRETLGECVVRKLELSQFNGVADNSNNTNGMDQIENNSKRIVLHYWYQNWADHKQANPQQVLQIALHVLGLPDIHASKYSATESVSSSADVTTSSSNSSSSSNEQELLVSATSSGTKFNFDSREFDFHRQRPESFNDFDRKRVGNSLDEEGVVVRSKSVASNQEKSTAIARNMFGSGGDEMSQNSSPAGVSIPPPVLVHCSAGIGRTGCFLAVLNGIQQLRSNYNVDVLAIVCSLRLNRGGMVQTAEQYELIHRVLSLYADHVICKQIE